MTTTDNGVPFWFQSGTDAQLDSAGVAHSDMAAA